MMDIIGVLSEKGLLKTPVSYWVSFESYRNYHFYVFGKKARFWVKVSPFCRLSDEYERLREAYSISRAFSFPFYVPQPYCVFKKDKLWFMVTSLEKYERISARNKQDFVHKISPLLENWEKFFKISKSKPNFHAEHIERWIAFSNDQLLLEKLRKLLRNERKTLEMLPLVKQHGDFTRVNLGIGKAKKFVIFDWEDFGKICIPGFDLATILIDLADFKEASLKELLSSIETKNILPQDIFLRLFPIYLAVLLGINLLNRKQNTANLIKNLAYAWIKHL